MYLARIQTNFRIEEKNPLKQGLKHEQGESEDYINKIEEKNPLKQGLKPAREALDVALEQD